MRTCQTCQFAEWYQGLDTGQCLFPMDLQRRIVAAHMPVVVDVSRLHTSEIQASESRECPVWIERRPHQRQDERGTR